MWPVFPTSDYYGDSVAMPDIQANAIAFAGLPV